MRQNSLARTPLVAVALAMLLVACEAAAQLPSARLFSVFPAGGRRGTTLEVTITGNDLEEVTQLYFDQPGLTAELVVEMKDGKPVPVPGNGPAKFKVTIAADAPLGRHDMRAIGRYGISNPRTFVVSDRAEVNETEPNNAPEQAMRLLADMAPAVTVNGQINGATDRDYFVFAAKAGQRVLVECDAQRIDSRLNGHLTLLGPKGKLIATCDDYHARDPFLDVSIPADGDYVVAITDQVFDGAVEYYYRLTIGTFPHIDYVLPPAGAPGVTGKFTLFGRNLPGGQPADGVTIQGRPLEKLDVDIAVPGDALAIQRLSTSSLVLPRESSTDAFDYRIATPQGSSGAVRIGITSLPLVVGAEPNDAADKAQPVTPPCEIYGQFQSADDIDWYSFKAKANEVWLFEVVSDRAGFRTDPFLLLRRGSDGAELANADDDGTNPVGLRFAMNNDDPILQSPPLAEGEYQVAVRSQYGALAGSARHVYRLRIRPLQPDFRLLAMHSIPTQQPNVAQQPQALLLRQGGNQHLDVYAVRRDTFNGEVTVQAEGLPQGVTCPPVVIGPGQTYAPLVLSAADDAPLAVASLKISGKAKIGDQEVSREARPAVLTWAFDPNQNVPSDARLANAIPLAVRDGAPYRVVATPERVEVSRGLPLKLKLQVARRGEFKAQIDGLTAVTLPPNAQNAAVGVAADKNEAELSLNMPPNVPVGTYTVAIRGNAPAVPFTKDPEGKNKQNIAVSDISTPVVVTITHPIGVEVQSPAAVKKGANVEVVAKVKRQGGYAGPVQLQFVSLPGNVSSPAVPVAPEANEGKLVITAAANAANGSFSNVILRGTVNVGGQNVNIDTPFTLNVE